MLTQHEKLKDILRKMLQSNQHDCSSKDKAAK
jgi:hypothetical protein